MLTTTMLRIFRVGHDALSSAYFFLRISYSIAADVCACALDIAASRAQMAEARIPLQNRDSCANLLIPLNRCRFEQYYLPWKCVVSLQLRF